MILLKIHDSVSQSLKLPYSGSLSLSILYFEVFFSNFIYLLNQINFFHKYLISDNSSARLAGEGRGESGEIPFNYSLSLNLLLVPLPKSLLTSRLNGV